MKKILLLCVAVLGLQTISAQKTYKFELQLIAEGNFGTPNGDVYTVSNTTGTTITSGPRYHNANTTATGFDVLQDFQIIGDKAVLLSKSSGFRVVIAEYPSLSHIHTFTGLGAPQTLTDAGENKAYLYSGNPNAIYQIDLLNNTAIAVTDPSTTPSINGTSTYMTYANGYVYAAISSKIVKIDPVTNTVVGTILPGIGGILGMQYDSNTQSLWLLGKVGTQSAFLRINTANNDSLDAPISLPEITNAKYLRLGNNKLYFLSANTVRAYNLDTPEVTSTPIVYTSTFANNWYFAYGKAFDVDPISGDFTIGSANAFTSGSSYEIVSGSDYQLIASGSVPGCIGVNELILKSEEVLGVNNPTADRFTAYPNPSSDIVTFHTESDYAYTVSLYDQLGALLFTSKSNGKDCKITVTDLASGIYYANLKSDSGESASSVKKIIVTH